MRCRDEMQRLLAHLGVGGDGGIKAAANTSAARSPLPMQADVQLLLGRRGDLRGLRDGIVESDVVFTQIAAAEIRSTVQQLVQSASGVRSCVHPNLSLVHPNLSMDMPTSVSSVSLTGSTRKNMQLKQSMQLHSWNEHSAQPRANTLRSKTKGNGSFMDGTMLDSDSSEALSPRPSIRLLRRRFVNDESNVDANHSLVQTVRTTSLQECVRAPRCVMNERKGNERLRKREIVYCLCRGL